MNIKKLTLNNFFCFGKDVSVDFSNYENLVLVKGQLDGGDNSNGAGKSSLFEALFWCLTGKTVRGVRAQDVVKSGESSVTVVVEFEHKGVDYTVVRNWSKSNKEVTIDIAGELERFHDSKQATVRIFELLEITPEILSLVVFYGKSFQTFSGLSPKERAEIVDLLAQGKKWEIGRVNAARNVKDLERDFVGITTQVDDATLSQKALESELSNLQQQIKQLKDAQATVQNEAQTALDLATAKESTAQHNLISPTEIEASRKAMAQQITAIELDIKKATDAKTAESLKKTNALEAEIEETTTVIKEVTMLLYELDFAIKGAKEQAQKERSTKGSIVCYACNEPLKNPPNNDEIEARAAAFDASVVVKEQEHVEFLSSLREMTDLINTQKAENKANSLDIHNAIELVKAPYLVKIKALTNTMFAEEQRYSAMQNEHTNCKSILSAAQTHFENVKNSPEVVRLETMISTKTVDLKNHKSRIIGLITKHKDLVLDISVSKYWSKGFKDLRFSAFENTIKTMQEMLNAFCQQQGLNFDSIEVASFKESASGNVKPEIAIYIIRSGKRLSLDQLSDGEKQRVDLACFFTFSLLIEKSLGFSVGFNILDEPLSGLDYEGRQKVFEIISGLAEDKQIVTIDHDANFQDMFNSVITVCKQNGQSVIKP